MSAETTLETIATDLEQLVEGKPKPVPVPATAIAPQDVAKFAAAFIAWLGKQEPTIMAGLSIADTLTKFVAVFVPGAEAVDLGIEMAETDIPIVYNVGTAALPFVADLASASTIFAPAPPVVLGAPRATGVV